MADVSTTSSSIRLEAGWPARPPLFMALTATDELRVPLSAHPADSPPGPLSGRLNLGDPLLDHPAESSHMAIAPAEATVGQIVKVPLLDGRHITAAKLNVVKRSDDVPAASESVAMREQVEFRELLLADVRAPDLVQWIERLRDAGVWADRWTSPDLLSQLNAALIRPIEGVVLNLLDADPTVPLNAALAANYPDELLAGLGLLARITGAARIIAAIDGLTPPSWLARLRPARGERRHNLTGLKLVEMANIYPQADPSLLLYSLFNKRLRPGQLPTDLGLIVLDVAAAVAVGRRFLYGESMLSVPVAIRDHARQSSHFCTALVGTLLSHVLRRVGLPPASQLVLRGGDVLRDIQITGEAVIGGSELVIHANGHELSNNPEPCIRCGWCFESCPTLVQPANCLEAAQRGDTALALRFGIDACIDCGICSYVCPSHLPILTGIRQLRSSMA